MKIEANSMAFFNAARAPSDPSNATNIFLYTCFTSKSCAILFLPIAFQFLVFGLEEPLSDEGRDDGTSDHHRDENGVLLYTTTKIAN